MSKGMSSACQIVCPAEALIGLEGDHNTQLSCLVHNRGNVPSGMLTSRRPSFTAILGLHSREKAGAKKRNMCVPYRANL